MICRLTTNNQWHFIADGNIDTLGNQLTCLREPFNFLVQHGMGVNSILEFRNGGAARAVELNNTQESDANDVSVQKKIRRVLTNALMLLFY